MIKILDSEYLFTLNIIELIFKHISAHYEKRVYKNEAFKEIFRKDGIKYELFNGFLIFKDNEVVIINLWNLYYSIFLKLIMQEQMTKC